MAIELEEIRPEELIIDEKSTRVVITDIKMPFSRWFVNAILFSLALTLVPIFWGAVFFLLLALGMPLTWILAGLSGQ